MDKEKIKKKLVGTLSFTAIKLRKKIFKNKNMRSINLSYMDSPVIARRIFINAPG